MRNGRHIPRDDLPSSPEEAIAEAESEGSLYAPESLVSNPILRKPLDEYDDDTLEQYGVKELNELLKQTKDERKHLFERVEDLIERHLIDVTAKDDLKQHSTYDLRPMCCAWVYRLVAASDGYSVVSWTELADRLEDDEIAESLGFGDERPSAKTLRTQWNTRVRPAFHEHIRYTAAEIAVKAVDYEVETADNIRENLMQEHWDDDKPDLDPIGEIEQEIKDKAYSFQADMIQDLCSYDRDDSVEYDADLFTDAAAHMCRLNEYAEQGIERMGKEYGLIDDDGRSDVFTQQTFRRTIRNVERVKVGGYDWDNSESYGACWMKPHDLVDPTLVQGEMREALEEEWTINPHDPDGDTATWHCRTEDGIEQQIEWLKSEGVIDDEQSFDLRIDYTTHNYNRHSTTDGIVPIGVHKQSHLETGYAWKELQATIKINGRAFVIASVNYLPTNKQFQCVRYLIDRAQELVNINTVLADAEFCTVAISRYAAHRGCDYVFRKGASESVKSTIEEDISGEADWVDDWTMITDGRFDHIDTTLVVLEKNFKSYSGDDDDDEDDEDENPNTTLDEYGADAEKEVDPKGQLTLEDAIEEGRYDSEDIDYFTMITNKPVDRTGINPQDKPVAHDPSGSAWGIGRLYRDRWGVETAFRDRKEKFQAQTTSRDLGYRRFLWMVSTLIYNGWVLLNTVVAEQSPAREYDEIVVKQNTYLDEIDRRVLSGLSLNIEFPDVEYD